MAVSDSAQNEGLVRVIGAGALGTSVINMVVGAGIFVLPGLVAALVGSCVAIYVARSAIRNRGKK